MAPRAISTCLAAAAALLASSALGQGQGSDEQGRPTATPIEHLVIIFQENVSFDHYFGTSPVAQNNPGETPFHASPGAREDINTLLTPLYVDDHFSPLKGLDLINRNPNGPLGSGAALNGEDASNPFRLTPRQAVTSDQEHEYRAEQLAFDNGRMDAFPRYAGRGGKPAGIGKKLTMGYYDGNTVTALWNYAQHYAMSDNFWSTGFGPSTPGALNLISGQTNGFDVAENVADPSGNPLHGDDETSDGNGNYSEIGDGDPALDACSDKKRERVTMHGRNIGDLLNEKEVSWGWFQGGFDLTMTSPKDPTGCLRSSAPTKDRPDYIPHHEPFQYYASTANPTHARPSSTQAIGHTRDPHTGARDPANHQYDIHDFFDALAVDNLPAVSFLKAPAYQDGHAGYSNPLDEQQFIVNVINVLQKRPEWKSTAVIIAYDDSDGWYDHQAPPIVNPSFSQADALNGPGVCDSGLQQGSPKRTTPLDGAFGKPAQGRCGYGTRLPMIVISPYAKTNYVDHSLTDQTSILRFIEDNWLAGQRIQPGGSLDTIAGPLENLFDFQMGGRDLAAKLELDPMTGAVVVLSASTGAGPRRNQ